MQTLRAWHSVRSETLIPTRLISDGLHITVRFTGQPEQISIPLNVSLELVHYHILQVCPSCPLGIDLTSDVDFVMTFPPSLIP
jgi:hypothetical protein